jgi:hypothetical protein
MTAKELCPSPAKIRDQKGCVLLNLGDLPASLPVLAIRSADLTELEWVRFVMKDGQVVTNELASH